MAHDAFDVEAADYLLKPVRLDRLRQAVERTRRRRAMLEAAEHVAAPLLPKVGENGQHARAIWVHVRGGRIRLPVDRIE